MLLFTLANLDMNVANLQNRYLSIDKKMYVYTFYPRSH